MGAAGTFGTKPPGKGEKSKSWSPGSDGLGGRLCVCAVPSPPPQIPRREPDSPASPDGRFGGTGDSHLWGEDEESLHPRAALALGCGQSASLGRPHRGGHTRASSPGFGPRRDGREGGGGAPPRCAGQDFVSAGVSRERNGGAGLKIPGRKRGCSRPERRKKGAAGAGIGTTGGAGGGCAPRSVPRSQARSPARPALPRGNFSRSGGVLCKSPVFLSFPERVWV